MNKVFAFVFNCTLVLCLIFGSFTNSVLAVEQQASSVNTAPNYGTETVKGVDKGRDSRYEASEQLSTEEREPSAKGVSSPSDNVTEDFGCRWGGSRYCYPDKGGKIICTPCPPM